MTREEIDTAWSRALGEAVKEGEQYTRYHFAAIIRAQAMEELGSKFKNQNAEYFGHEIQDAIESLKGQP